MNAFNGLFVLIVVILLMSYGTGLIIGGPVMADRIIAEEVKLLLKIGRWILKQVLRFIAYMCTWLHTKL